MRWRPPPPGQAWRAGITEQEHHRLPGSNTLHVRRVHKLGFRKQGEVSVLTREVALQSPRVGQ